MSLRVLHVTNMWPVGDSFRGIFVKEQVDALRELGVEIDVEIVAQARGRRDYLLAARRIRRKVRTGGYDLVHVHHGMCGVATRFLGRTPRVLGLYGHDVNWHWQRWITRLGWGGVAAKVYVSRRMAVAANDPDGHVILNGVNFGLFDPATVDRAAARRQLGIADNEKAVLFGGRPEDWVKGYDIFRDVLDELRHRGFPVREIVLPEPGQTRAGVVPKFAAADALLFTSLKGFEGSPTVVKEATAIGLPVVTTDVGDVAEVLAEVTPSFTVDFPEPWPAARSRLVVALADRMGDVLAAGTRSDGRTKNIRLAWDTIARDVLALYEKVLNR